LELVRFDMDIIILTTTFRFYQCCSSNLYNSYLYT